MSNERTSHVFGPVPSRRLGRSLGVDLVPFKVCSLDCIYCQLGGTTTKTLHRDVYVCVDEIIEDVDTALRRGPSPDYVTLSGSGEPTLHVYLDEIIRRVRKLTDLPVALLTNGVLFYREDVRADAALADLVLPSLDAPNADLFRRINRPPPSVTFERYVDGLVNFRDEFEGEIWLEVFILRDINDTEEHILELREHVRRIRPDRIQLNTAVRPTTSEEAVQVPREKLESFRRLLGPDASVIADYSAPEAREHAAATRERVLELIRRRPCTLDDVAAGLGIHRNEAVKQLEMLVKDHSAICERRGANAYYRRVG
jgi:wyosine [tRNA(Phe)-imidazoG37] synthetase (radical SAM superfamily)